MQLCSADIGSGAIRAANSRADDGAGARLAGSGMVAVPEQRRGIFPRPRPTMLGEAQVLQVGVGDAGHQRVPMQAGPGSALEVAEAEFLA